MHNFNILYFLQQNKLLIFLILMVFVLYFILEKIFGSKKELKDDDSDDEIKLEDLKENKKSNVGYKSYSSSYITERKDYDFIPKDGSSVRVNNYNKKRYVKKKQKNDLSGKEKLYNELFYIKKETDLSKAAFFMKISNDDLYDDLKLYKKEGKFLDIDIDIINCKIIYANDIMNKDSDVFYFEDDNEIKENNVLDNGMIKHKCPNCGTENIIDKSTKKYNCYYCLQEICVK